MHTPYVDRVSAPSSNAVLSWLVRRPALAESRLTEVPDKADALTLDVRERLHARLERGGELDGAVGLADCECAGVRARDVERDAPGVRSHEEGEWCGDWVSCLCEGWNLCFVI